MITCFRCGGRVSGSPAHCEFYDLRGDEEQDSGPWYCKPRIYLRNTRYGWGYFLDHRSGPVALGFVHHDILLEDVIQVALLFNICRI